ncbi:hypothetical protein EXIGLDRAFT_769417 [Exidia glandulosa HHB12029]|uniref:Uncharacterized protein n=1 Tax=Exidia glandulosa HHB12029 TaxID=1314781 RepID=A0A165HIJ0_EXIGL|nr:hypothetical protein EXIGLDRAFT_769417 [Exidia glandulosa HHB12029]
MSAHDHTDDHDHDLGRPPNLRHSRSSIDESLELEHALAQAEGDVPPSPSAAAFLDPQILADLIIQLRSSLANMTSERDELITELAASQTREAELHDALDQAREGRKTAQTELEKARKTHTEDEEAIGMLRAKVEESRRALMRLQSEATSARRSSAQFQLGGPLALDLSAARNATGSTSKSSKRMSFTPMTGSFTSPPPLKRNASDESGEAAETQSLMILPTESANGGQRTARAGRFPSMSATSGRSPPRESLLNPLGAELDALRRELVEARQEGISLRAELRDAKEGRMASEAVAQALREFIASAALDGSALSPTEGGSRGLGISLPPLPSDTGVNEVGDEKPKASWGLKLWRKDTNMTTSSSSHHSTPSVASSRRKSDASMAESPAGGIAPSRSGFWSSSKGSQSAAPSTAVSPATSLPPSKKFGFLWGSTGPPPTPPKDDVAAIKPDDHPHTPALSPPGSNDGTSAHAPSEPTSPKPQEHDTEDLVVQFDDTLTDSESVHEPEHRELDADKTLVVDTTPQKEGPLGTPVTAA